MPYERDESHAVEATQWMVAGKDESPVARDVVDTHSFILDVEVVECDIGCFDAFLVAHVGENLVQTILVDSAFNPADEPLWDVTVVTRQSLPNHTVNIDAKWLCLHVANCFLTYKGRKYYSNLRRLIKKVSKKCDKSQ